MTPQEFNGPFTVLCRGLDCHPTAEQLSAWFRRIGHISAEVWWWTVDTLLFDGRKGYLPKLDHVLDVIERETDTRRKMAVARDQAKAQNTYARLQAETNPLDQSRIPTPGSPLFACIRAFAGQRDCRRRLARLDGMTEWPDARKARERLNGFLAQHTRELERWHGELHDEDAARLVREYETEGVAS